MPLSKDPQGGGSERDGGKSAEYCSHCYRNGQFTEPDLTAELMMGKVEAKLRTMHFPGFLAKRFAKSIPSLNRWNAATSETRR
jgi:hypothetical protein